MPPNMQTEEMASSTSFIDNFWSVNKTGMEKLLDYIDSTHHDLNIIQNIYMERSQIEKDYGQRLLSLSEKYKDDISETHVYQAILTELNKTAHSRIDFSEKLQGQITTDLEQKLDEYKVLMEKWTMTLEEVFNEKQMRIEELLNVRAKYLKEYEISKGQSTSLSEKLKSQYKVLVVDVDEIAQVWNTAWQEACEVMEAMEEDRIELIKGNVWEYANLGSSTLIIQDQWCENIRTKLEECSVEEEIERCVSLYATGSRIPSTNDYVDEIRSEQKRRRAHNDIPKLPSKPQKQQTITKQTERRPQSISRQNSVESDRHSLQGSKEVAPVKPQRKSAQRPESHIQHKVPEKEVASDIEQSSNDEKTDKKSTPVNDKRPTISRQSTNTSQSGGSIAHRAPIRRKPLDKALMEQVTNEMELAKKQRETEASIKQTPKNTVVVNRNKEDSSKHTVDSSDAVQPGGTTTTADTINVSRRQASEYKPDTGSIPARRGNITYTAKESVQPLNINTNLNHGQMTHPIAAPKSPRPSPQQIPEDAQHNSSQAGYAVNNYDGSQHHMGQQPYTAPHVSHMHPVQQPSQLQHSPMMHPQRSPMMQPQVSPMMQPQVSPMMQPQVSPMMQPPKSPMMQPQKSPLMQPQRSPMMQPQVSPMMQPQVSPMMQPQKSPIIPAQMSPMMPYMSGTYLGQHSRDPQHQRQGIIPAPITIPHHNYIASPQPSPNPTHANPEYGAVSPAIPYQQLPPKPTHYIDGRPILFWVRSKYNYTADDSEELSFNAYAAIGIVDGDINQEAWWNGAVFDESTQTWSNIGSVPSNFTEPDQPNYHNRKANGYY